MKRRELLQWGLTATTFYLLGGQLSARTAKAAHLILDHILLGASDLDQGIAWVEEKTGVRATLGGSHPGKGTRNALISLGNKQYLEIIAPDPGQKKYDLHIDIRDLSEPQVITWAAATNDIKKLAEQLKAEKLEVFGPAAGSRARPDGKILKWESLGIKNNLGKPTVEPVPFFIQWSTHSLHPSEDSPKGCELQSFEILHPDPSAVRQFFNRLGIDARATQAATAHFKVTLKTPRGPVEIA